MSNRPTLYMNKPAWPSSHPITTTKAMAVKDYAWEDTYKFIKMIQDTSQCQIRLVKSIPEMTPLPLRTFVQYELRGITSGGQAKILGWLNFKPRSWNYALGVVRKSAGEVS